MKSEDIASKSNDNVFGPGHLGFIAVADWLREIAYQLAMMNERAVRAPGIEAEREFQRLVSKLPKLKVPLVNDRTDHHTPEPHYGCPHDPMAECNECRRDRTFGS